MPKKNTKPGNADAAPKIPHKGRRVSAPGPAAASRAPVPVVGIGASAGGLEALELFLRHVPDGAGLAFVIVQHLDPTQKGGMPELLQRVTAMPVLEIEDKTIIEPGHVYVIPPNADLSILGDALHLFAPTQARGLRLPIDFFLRSLADDRRENSLGVILSGMGSDGMLGLRAIKEHGGGTFVQDPASAKFDGMPRSSIDAGLADVVAPVEDLPGDILAYVKRVPLAAKSLEMASDKEKNALDKVLILLRNQTGHDFSQYKKTTLYRRIERRMGLNQIGGIASYVRYLRENRQEIELLFKELLIGVTNFFRDPEAWGYLKDEVIPALLATRPKGGTLRAWTPGCSTGEEAYSLAMVFKEALDAFDPPRRHALQIFATDLDPDAIEKARSGVYPENISSDVSPERLRRFFFKDDRGWRIVDEIREAVVFAPHNLLMDPPFTKLDILVCRNLLIYLNQDLQKRLLPLFHYCLNPGGALFLGSAETLGAFTGLFSPLNAKFRLYRRLDAAMQAVPVEFPSRLGEAARTEASPPVPPPANIQALTEQRLLQRYAPAAVLTTDKGDIVFISGRTGKYLEPAAGKANLNVFAMARDGLRLELHSAFAKAVRLQETVIAKGVLVGTNGGTQRLDVTVEPMIGPSPLRGLILIVFEDVPLARTTVADSLPPGAGNASQLEALKMELQQALENVQISREEMQTSQEELKSSNEELQSTNEELQSTNEELTTSKEEMQSMNEELQTVNYELQAKLDNLTRVNNDMKNLLDSTDIATLFLDEDFKVRRFTNQVTSIFKLIPGDVGRPITDVATRLDYPDLIPDAQSVLRTLIFVEKPVPAADDRWFLARIMPYRTQDNRIDGLVITFSDISVSKRLEARLREKEQSALELFKNMPAPFALLDAVLHDAGEFVDGRIVFVNAAFERLMGVDREGVTGKTLGDLFGAGAGWLEACAKASLHGVSSVFAMRVERIGKTLDCSAYRLTEDSERFCLMFATPGGCSP